MTLGEYIAEQFRKAFGEALEDKNDLVEKWSREAANNVGTAQIESMSPGAGGLLGILEGLPIIGGVVGEVLDPLRLVLGKAGGMVEGVALGWALGTAIYPALRALFLPLIHGINDATTNEIFDPTTAADLVTRGLMEHGHGADESSGGGFDTDHFNHLVALATTHPDVTTLHELLRRGLVSESFVNTTLTRLGYTSEAAGALNGLARNLLSPADLALAYLRTSITKETMLGYAQQLGVTPNDMQVLIDNTGEPIGLMELLEAYRRGFIDKARLERGIRQSRVRNEWIDVAEKLRFAPMSTAEATRATVESYITPQEGGKIAEQNGLDPKHWPIVLESWGRPLAHGQMASLVHRGLASRKQFDQAMRESDIKNKYIHQSFEVADRLLPERLIVQAIHFSAIDLKVGARMLLQLGYKPESVAILLKLGLHEAQIKPHELTATQIVNLYEQGTLHRDQAVRHLEAIKYSQTNANYLLQLADTRAHLKEVAQEQQAIRNSYLAGTLDAQHAEEQLRQIGITQSQAAHLIGVWNRERRRASKTLTETQIVHAAKEGTIHYDEGVTLLLALGYTKNSADILLQSNGATPPQRTTPPTGTPGR